MLGKVVLKVEGVNISKTLDDIKDKYVLKNIKKFGNTTTFLTIGASSCTKLIDYLKQKCYNVSVVKFSVFLRFCIFFRKFWLQIAVFCFCFVVLCTLSNMVLGTNFKQSDAQCNQQIGQVLKNAGVFGKFRSDINKTQIEQQILSEVEDISLVDLSFVGCFLNINYTKKTNPTTTQQKNEGPMLAKEDGLVSRVFVVSGTLLVSAGTWVKKGQPLIADYFVDKDGNTVPCEAKGEVFVSVWQNNTTQFCEDMVLYVPTGREVESATILCFGKQIECKKPDINFEHFEQKTEEQQLVDFGLPLKVCITKTIETTPQRVHQNFEDNVESLKFEAKETLLKNLDVSQILEEKYTISKVADIYFVTYYAKTEKLIT